MVSLTAFPPSQPIVIRQSRLGHIATVVTGIQHSILSMILLAVYNPSLPRLGPGQRAALLNVDDEIKTNIRSLCGMALSNRKTPPHMITACMGISMCKSNFTLLGSELEYADASSWILGGERFTERVEQDALLDILVQTDREHAWPTTAAQKQLRESWGWDLE